MFATPSGFHCLSYIANHIRMPWLANARNRSWD
jgi:hypothetical protein